MKKTLDEVIEALHNCADVNANFEACDLCEYKDIHDDGYECGCLQMMTDALHYLKHLQEYYEMSREHHEPNPALTWEQLKQMEGKPVWFEYDNHLSGRKRIKYKVWDVIDWVTEDLILVKGDYSYQKDEFGDVWQVYRKERS